MAKYEMFQDLFVLELANNHWGNVERGLAIIEQFAQVVRQNCVKAAIKLQFRDVPKFVHKDFISNSDIRYVKKTIDTQLSVAELGVLSEAIRNSGCLVMATPFDEKSVDTCVDLNMDIIKIASSDIQDWRLIRKIAETGKPVIFSTGGSTIQEIDRLVSFFEERDIPIAINHCVSIYPSEDNELEMNQIDFFRERYPNHVIGFSTHEYHDWSTSMYIAYAKGARTFERHIDIEADGIPVSPYCSLPHQVDEWMRAYKKAAAMCGKLGIEKRKPPQKELDYLNSLVRGTYLKRDLLEGTVLTEDDVYFAIPLQTGQINCRQFIAGTVLSNDVAKDRALLSDDIHINTTNSVAEMQASVIGPSGKGTR